MDRRSFLKSLVTAATGATIGWTARGLTPTNANRPFSETIIHASEETKVAFPAVRERFQIWFNGAVKEAYVISPEDILTTLEDKESAKLIGDAYEVAKKFRAREISSEEQKKFFDDNNIHARVTEAARIFLQEKYPKAASALSHPENAEIDVIPDFAKELMLGSASSLGFSTNLTNKKNSAIIVTWFRDTSDEMDACYISGIPLKHIGKIGCNKGELINLTLAHEVSHITRDGTERDADLGAAEIYNNDLKSGFFKTPGLIDLQRGLRAIGAILGPSGNNHATSAVINLHANEPTLADASMLQYVRNLDQLNYNIAIMAASSSDYHAVLAAAMRTVIKKFGNQVTKDELKIIRQIEGYATAETPDKTSAQEQINTLFSKLSQETQGAVYTENQNFFADVGFRLFEGDLPLVYQSAENVYNSKEFDSDFENPVGAYIARLYAWKFLEAAKKYFPATFNADPNKKFEPPVLKQEPGPNKTYDRSGKTVSLSPEPTHS